MKNKLKLSMISLVVNSLEMWDKCSGKKGKFSGKKLYFKNRTSFLHYIWREDNMNQILNIYIKNVWVKLVENVSFTDQSL